MRSLPPERVWGEWQKWALKGRVPSAGLRALHESGWLAHYPELAALVGCQQRALYHPEGDVWTHTGHVCDAAAQIAEREQLDDLAREALLFGALCHDLGKPRTTTVIDGAHRSPGHAKAGVPPTETFLVRIGAPKRLLTHTVPLVREHMAHVGSNVSERTARRLALRLEPATIRLWEMLVEADFSGRPPMPPGRPGAELAALAERLGVSEARPAPVVQGRHLAAAGVVAGPEMGELLRHAYQAQIDGAFTTLDEGLAWIARLRGARAVRDP
jgi:tRNA nucleotidyltransferase (CCA-adding enzyme)